MKHGSTLSILLFITSIASYAQTIEPIAPNVQLIRGPINGVLIEQAGKTLAIYGDPRSNPADIDTVLFTDDRRDLTWAGRDIAMQGANAIVPVSAEASFTQAEQFWNEFLTKRFHDYQQKTTKRPLVSIPVHRTVIDGDTVEWNGLTFEVLDTPGYAENSVTYLAEIGDKRIAFTGALIIEDGKIFDLYSLQDDLPEAKFGGYHGFASRSAELIESLRKILARKPDLLVPVYGPVIQDPEHAIQTLISRIQRVYKNYLSISALRWYRDAETLMVRGLRILDPSDTVDWMPQAETQEKLPEWLTNIQNSRLILSKEKHGFLLDCGGRTIIDKIAEMKQTVGHKGIQGLFITHYHDDHTDQAANGAQIFGCPIYATPLLAEILETPFAFRLPAMTVSPMTVQVMEDKQTLRWQEFLFTFYDFPGQTYLHDALLVQRDFGDSVLFLGDSFTPTGMDDYCAQNRNFLQPDRGYDYCLKMLAKLPRETWLVNQHVEPLFRFTSEQIQFMQDRLTERKELLSDLFPWDNPNFGIDEGWARFYPYEMRIGEEGTYPLHLKIFNHSDQPKTYSAKLNLPMGWLSDLESIEIPARSEGELHFELSPRNPKPGLQMITADLLIGDQILKEFTEGMLVVE